MTKMESPRPVRDLGSSSSGGAGSARSPENVGVRWHPAGIEGSASTLNTPASAEEQLEMFKKASRFKNLNSASQ